MELEYFKCVLLDKFVAGTIIAKLPPSWNDFATSLKNKRHEFSVLDLITLLGKTLYTETYPQRGLKTDVTAN